MRVCCWGKQASKNRCCLFADLPPNLAPPPADHDDRVVPLHSHKLTATLQHVLAGGLGWAVASEALQLLYCKQRLQAGNIGPVLTAILCCHPCLPAGAKDSAQRNPLLTRVEVKAGHGAGKPTTKVIEETSDMMAFAAAAMGAKWAHQAQAAQE